MSLLKPCVIKIFCSTVTLCDLLLIITDYLINHLPIITTFISGRLAKFLCASLLIQRITRCPHGYHHNDFVETPALGTQYSFIFIYILTYPLSLTSSAICRSWNDDGVVPFLLLVSCVLPQLHRRNASSLVEQDWM